MYKKKDMDMAYDEKTLVPLHKLTVDGKEKYEKMLQEKADEILYEAEHPFEYYSELVVGYFRKLLRRLNEHIFGF